MGIDASRMRKVLQPSSLLQGLYQTCPGCDEGFSSERSHSLGCSLFANQKTPLSSLEQSSSPIALTVSLSAMVVKSDCWCPSLYAHHRWMRTLALHASFGWGSTYDGSIPSLF